VTDKKSLQIIRQAYWQDRHDAAMRLANASAPSFEYLVEQREALHAAHLTIQALTAVIEELP
jgi:hypothetical protein